MSKVFVSVTLSLDGYLAPESRWDDVGDKRWFAQWMTLQRHVFQQRFFRQNLGFGSDGLDGPDNDVLQETFDRTGATVLGKRMFDAGERMWPENAPFHTPVFVLTRQVREPWVRPGGTTFHFVNDGVVAALERAREAAGDRDVRIGGGAHTIREYLQAGLVDELHLAVAPVLLGGGLRLLDGLDPDIALEITRQVPSPLVTHHFYTVKRPSS